MSFKTTPQHKQSETCESHFDNVVFVTGTECFNDTSQKIVVHLQRMFINKYVSSLLQLYLYIVSNVFRECHAPCTLMISFVDFEKKQGHCSVTKTKLFVPTYICIIYDNEECHVRMTNYIQNCKDEVHILTGIIS